MDSNCNNMLSVAEIEAYIHDEVRLLLWAPCIMYFELPTHSNMLTRVTATALVCAR
jgi:hypothetical protein